MDENKNGPTNNSQTNKNQPGCWARFKTMFEGRGFDLEYEYNHGRHKNILEENQNDTDGYRRIEDRKSLNKRTTFEATNETNNGEITGEINFYEQFATLGDDYKEEYDIWRKSSGIRKRVSIRPSVLLTNIAEEIGEDDDVEVVSLDIMCVEVN